LPTTSDGIGAGDEPEGVATGKAEGVAGACSGDRPT
jgi:hypothetical protein